MKKIALLPLILLFAFTSCSSDNDFDSSGVELLKSENKASYQEDTLRLRATPSRYPIEISGLYHIRVAGGISNDRKYLSASQDGSTVNLWPIDDNSGRQKWVITKYYTKNDDLMYIITVQGGISNDKKYLSFTTDGHHVRLYNIIEPGELTRQTFTIVPELSPEPNISSKMIIQVQGYLSEFRPYLSVLKDGTECVGWSDFNTLRERWYLEKIN